MQQTNHKLIEFFLIFILVPVSFAFQFSIWIKLIIGLFGFGYVIFVLIKEEGKKFKMAAHLNWSKFWKDTFLKLLGIVVITIIYMWFVDKESLFVVLYNKPILWIVILFVYSIFSVYPQELIYRTFFFQRYTQIIKSDNLLIFINAIVFSLAHIFFKNALVMVLTFLGGLLFAFTYKKTNSTLLVTIEHAIYGCWLFTVGMGSMLGFPS